MPSISQKQPNARSSLVTASGLVDHGHIVSCCLVVLHPAAIDKVKLPFSDKVPDLVFGIIGLLPPPAREERLQREEKREGRPPSNLARWGYLAAGIMQLQDLNIADVCLRYWEFLQLEACG